MARDAAELAHRLARNADAVCRHYLSSGCRQGGYWLVCDVRNTPGRALFVRLRGAEPGRAMIARVRDLDGKTTGVHRPWLDPSGRDKAPIDTPRRAMGELLGNAVRFGAVGEVMAAGEGIETMLSLRCIVPAMPMVAA